MRDHEFWLIDQGVHMVHNYHPNFKSSSLKYESYSHSSSWTEKFAFGLSWTRVFWYYWTCLGYPWFLLPHFVQMYTWMEIWQSCAWIDKGYLAELLVNVASTSSATWSPQGMWSEADALSKRRPRVFSTWESQHKKRVIVPCCVMLRKQPQTWDSGADSRSLRFEPCTSAVHLPTAKSPSSIFFRWTSWWTNVCTT